MNVIEILMHLIAKCIFKTNIEDKLFAEKDITREYVWKYRFNYKFDLEDEINKKKSKILNKAWQEYKYYILENVRKTK